MSTSGITPRVARSTRSHAGSAVDDPAVVRLGRIVHDLDLPDGRYGLPETAAVGQLAIGCANFPSATTRCSSRASRCLNRWRVRCRVPCTGTADRETPHAPFPAVIANLEVMTMKTMSTRGVLAAAALVVVLSQRAEIRVYEVRD